MPGRVLPATYRSWTVGNSSPSSPPPLGAATMVMCRWMWMWMWTVPAWITTRPSPTSRDAVSGSAAAVAGGRLSASASSGM